MLKVVEAAADSTVSPLWFPGKPNYVYPLSARAQEIAKSREEMMSLLRDLPESDYELSFKDLVERGHDGSQDSGKKEDKKHCPATFRTSSVSRREIQGSNGVLLNVFVPVSLKRSHRRTKSTAPNPSYGFDDERVSESTSPGCWSILCRQKSRGKSQTDGRKL